MKKVLVIEDESAVLENILEIIEEFDYEVFGASNGIEGLKQAKENLPDLIICDIMMPELDGFGVITELQKDQQTAAIPFIFLTAKADREDLRQGMNLGADDYLTKPFTPEQLFKAIETRIKKQEKFKEKGEEKLDELRINLASTLPHEFRTPLNGILASSQFLKEYFDTLEKEEISQLHENIHSSAQRLHRLILNYLFYADLELLKHEIIKRRSDPNVITFSPTKSIHSYANKLAEVEKRSDDISYETEFNPDIRIVQEHFMKICEELIDNAIKFSNSGSKIYIKTESKNNMFKLSVKDFGRGMTVEQISGIGAYVQYNRKIYEQQGSGLGLIIVKRLAELYGGSFEISSKLNEFTKISVSIPM